MYLLYESLIDRIKRDDIMRYNLKHRRGVRADVPKLPTKQEGRAPQNQFKATGNSRRVNRQFRRPLQQANESEHAQTQSSSAEIATVIQLKQSSPKQVKAEASPQQQPSPDRAINVKLTSRQLPTEFPEEEEERVPCTEGCGRSFALKVLQKHMKICRKAHQSKREVFVIKQDPEIENVKKHLPKAKEAPAEEKSEQVPKWQRQSEIFRLNLKRGKGTLTAEQQKLLKELEGDDRVQCPICSCKFNPKVFDRHKSFCEDRAKKKKK